MRDKYDDAIAYLTEHPEQIHQVWNNPEKYPAGCLFEYAGDPHARDIGCLTLIRGPNSWIAETPELTAAIREDERIPVCEKSVTTADLLVFAEWQRRLDRELKYRNSVETTCPQP